MPLESDGIELGCRVMKAEDVHSAVRMLPIGTTPQFTQITLSPPLKDVAFGDHGWRIESFIADEVLRCREGRRFDETQDADLHALLYLREYPISSLIQITVDLPEEKRVPKALAKSKRRIRRKN
jgi:hypothetical protein